MKKNCILGFILLYTLAFGPMLSSYCMVYNHESEDLLGMTSSECPPGFSNKDKGNCTCAASDYLGIWKCNKTRAYVIHGYWVGYCNEEKSTHKICTGRCPPGFCAYNDTSDEEGLYLLPANASELDGFICGPTRTGTLCGNCTDGYSVYYHSWPYKCGPNHNCHLGLLFYFLSELLPLTVLFITVIIFNISFTSGATTGFIFFAQVIDSISVDANGIIQTSSSISAVRSAQRFVYRLFNLYFFSLDDLSFCLWEGATMQNVMLMKYVTIVFALGLVLCAFFVMNVCRCNRCLVARTFRRTLIHGISAFFIMCYAQCCMVSFMFLCSSGLINQGLKVEREVFFFSGELEYLRGEHLKYAIPAIVFFITLSILPCLLIAYPLSGKVLGFCNLSESRLINRITRLIPIQLLDSFQSCFKDNLRFFAGLYFFYRMFAAAAYAFADSLTLFYAVAELQLIVILVIHAVVQPYKKRWHNVVDALMFANLAIINGLTLYNFAKTTERNDDEHTTKRVINSMSIIQLILSFLPIIYIASYVVFQIFTEFRRWQSNCQEHRLAREEFDDYDSLPSLRDPQEPLIEPNLRHVRPGYRSIQNNTY